MQTTNFFKHIVSNAFLILLSALILSGCTVKPAPIINNSKNIYRKGSNYNKDKYIEVKQQDLGVRSVDLDSNKGEKTTAIKEVTISETKSNNAPKQPQQIEIAQGDTLYSISKKYETPLRDIIEENKLSAPYILKPGSTITIPQPVYYEVKAGDTLYSISRRFQMNIDNIVALNDLKQPYQVNAGRKIKISNSALKNEIEPAPMPKEEKIIAVKPIVVAVGSKGLIKNAPEPVARPDDKKIISPAENLFADKTNHFSWPLSGAIISKFGPKTGGLYNDGINIKAKEGALVKAAEDGAVAYVGNELKGYGNLIIIKHAGGWITAYAHLSKTNVKRGQKVTKSQIIAAVGSTGHVDAPQLYFGLRKGRDAVNPESYLK